MVGPGRILLRKTAKLELRDKYTDLYGRGWVYAQQRINENRHTDRRDNVSFLNFADSNLLDHKIQVMMTCGEHCTVVNLHV